jgi:hypothetical protein
VRKPLAALARGLGVRIYRDGKPYGFWEPEAQALHPGDCIVEIVPTSVTEAHPVRPPHLEKATVGVYVGRLP